jgi:hypothetical protein
MVPMMHPAPRPILRRKAAGQQPVAKEKPPERGRLAIVAACVGLAVGLVLIAILGAWPRLKKRPAKEPLTAEEAEAMTQRMLESNHGWFEGLGAPVTTDRVLQALADNPNLSPDHLERRTKFVRINLRVLKYTPPVEDSSGNPIPVNEQETGSRPGVAPSGPRPSQTPEVPGTPGTPGTPAGQQPPVAPVAPVAPQPPPATQPPKAPEPPPAEGGPAAKE